MSDVLAKFAAAVAEIEAVQKNKEADTGSYTYRYVDLGTILAAVHKACNAHRLSIVQHLVEHGDRQQLITTIIDSYDGATAEFGGPVFPVKGEPQATGSALSYYRRYALVTLFAMNVEDDDGGQAQRAAVTPQYRTESEGLIRDGLAAMTNDEVEAFAADFKDEFGSTLTRLPESRHGDALAYFKHWTTPQEDAAS